MTGNTYSRRISSEEELEGYILILKNKLAFFPLRGERFQLRSGNNALQVSVESYPCQCRGPDLPHEHYFIRWPGLKRGGKVAIQRTPVRSKEFTLTVS